jgi:hypothetical protein
MAQPAMRAQREGGSERAAVVNLGQADLMGDGIDYTVRGTPREREAVVPENVKSGTVTERGRLGQLSTASLVRSAPAVAKFSLGARALRAHERHR